MSSGRAKDTVSPRRRPVQRRAPRSSPRFPRDRGTARVLDFPGSLPNPTRAVLWAQCRAAELRRHAKYEAIGVPMPPVTRSKVRDTIALLETLAALVCECGDCESLNVADGLAIADRLCRVYAPRRAFDAVSRVDVASALDRLAAEARLA